MFTEVICLDSVTIEPAEMGRKSGETRTALLLGEDSQKRRQLQGNGLAAIFLPVAEEETITDSAL